MFGNLIPAPYAIIARIGIVVLVLVGAFATGWIKRGAHDEYLLQEQIIKDQQTVIHINTKQDDIDNKAVTELQGKLTVLRKRNNDLQIRIETLSDTYNLSSDWVHIYNESIHDAGTTTKPNGSTGAAPTPARK